jgi:hypothetical protein
VPGSASSVDRGRQEKPPRGRGCVVLDGELAGEPLGFGGGARWRRLQGNRAVASPASGGKGWGGAGCGWCWEEGNEGDASEVSETTGGHVSRVRLCALNILSMPGMRLDR